MSSTLRNGETRDLNLTASDYITLVAVSGTYTATVVRGNSSGTVLGTNVTGGTYGPYTGGAVIRVVTSASSEVDFDIGASPVIVSDTFVTASTNLTGGMEFLEGSNKLKPRPADFGMAQSLCVVGDSFAQQSNGGTSVGITCTRSNGIVTVTGATNHPFYPGSLCSAVGFADSANEVQNAVVQSYISSSSFTYSHAGTDGAMAERSANSSVVMMPQSYQSIGFFSNFNRLTAGAYRLVSNAGFPGASTTVVASKVAAFVAPWNPDRCVYLAGYNDLTVGMTVTQTVAAIKEAVMLVPGALWDIFSTFPFASGSANNTAANLRQLSQYYPLLKATFASYPNVRVHNSLALFGLSTGFAKTGYVAADNIHPTQRCMYEAAKYLVALDSVKQTGAALPCTALDTYGVIATSKNLIDNPLMTGSGGAVLTNVTGTVPTGGSGALTGTGASGVSSTPARADGFGNDWQIVYTPANADNALRMSFSGLNARFVSGGTIDQFVMRVSIAGLVAGNVKQVNAVVVFIADGVTYAAACQDSSGAGTAIANMQQEDITELVFTLRDVAVPVFTSLTTARFDLTVSHIASSASAVTVKLGQAQVTLR